MRLGGAPRPRGSLREAEEHLKEGHLSTLTELNIEVIDRLRAMLAPEVAERLEIRTYDEWVLRAPSWRCSVWSAHGQRVAEEVDGELPGDGRRLGVAEAVEEQEVVDHAGDS